MLRNKCNVNLGILLRLVLIINVGNVMIYVYGIVHCDLLKEMLHKTNINKD